MAHYLNNSKRLITVSVLSEAKVLVKSKFVPGIPSEMDAKLMDKARTEYKVVQHYFSSGELRKVSGSETKPVTEELDEANKNKESGNAGENDKDFMLKALQESGIEEYESWDGRRSEKSVKEAYAKLLSSREDDK